MAPRVKVSETAASTPQRAKAQRSKRQKTWTADITEGPTYYPTWQEFKDPMQYISSIEAQASQFGICKIVPPVTASTPAPGIDSLFSKPFVFDTRQQWVRKQEWKSFSSEQFFDGSVYTLAEYEAMANSVQQHKFGVAGSLPAAKIEEAYWREVEAGNGVSVEYGNDIEGTAFSSPTSSDPLASSPWNLQVLPTLQNSTLRLVPHAIPGVSTPMLYVGMLFSAFAWHVEDQYLYSINYQHLGAAKTWYGVSSSGADDFEKVVQSIIYRKAANAAAGKGATEEEIRKAALRTLLRKTTVFSPRILLEAGVPVCRAVQAPGEFIVTFPRAYHAGFSNGFCVGEAANFGMGAWFKFGAQACARYCQLGHPIMLPQEELLCTEAQLLTDMSSEERRVHTTYPAGSEFVKTIQRYNEDTRRLIEMGASIQGATDQPVRGHACDICSYPCYIGRVALRHKGLSCCFPCALSRSNFVKGAQILRHPRFSAFQQMVAQLQATEPARLDAAPVSSPTTEGISGKETSSGLPAGLRLARNSPLRQQACTS